VTKILPLHLLLLLLLFFPTEYVYHD